MAESRVHVLGKQADTGTRDEGPLWAALAAAAGPAEFCRAWLDLQCARTPGASGGLVLLESGQGRFAPAAIWPAGPSNIEPLRRAGEAALTAARTVIEPDPEQPELTCIAYPIASGAGLHGVVVLGIIGAQPSQLQATLRELHWGVGWILSIVWQHRAEETGRGGTAAARAMDLLAAVNEHDTLHESAMALCNELGRMAGAERVACGLVKKESVKLTALSHGAWFRKRSDFAEAIEAAMDEAYDQQATIVYPIEEGAADTRITIQHARLASISGNASMLSVPVVDRGLTVGVVTLAREAEGEPFSPADLLLVEAAVALVAPGIELKRREARFVSGRIRRKAMDGAKALLGPRHPLAKLLGGGALVLLVLLLLPIAQFRVSAEAALEGRVQRAAAVPFSGFIARSNARAGDIVQAGQVLAVLDDRDLKLEHARSLGEVSRLDRQYRQALAQHERAEMNLYGAQLRQADAQLRLIEYKLARVNIVAPIAGVLVSGDVSQLVGSPVEEGEVMFEVAPLGDFRVALQVEEGDISFLQPGQQGRFAPTGLAGRTVPFTVTKLTSVTANHDGKNVFRVEAELGQDAPGTLRPGMEGVAKVAIDRRSQLWIWTRGLRDWLRLFLWRWLP